jgi:hypothetical protein
MNTYNVRIPWRDGDQPSDWDETCVWAIEHFGLPGQRYICKPTEDYMDFKFNEEKDSILFALRWSK